eukprot:UN34740
MQIVYMYLCNPLVRTNTVCFSIVTICLWAIGAYYYNWILMVISLSFCVPFKTCLVLTSNFNIAVYTWTKFETWYKVGNGLLFCICMPIICTKYTFVILSDIGFLATVTAYSITDAWAVGRPEKLCWGVGA